MLFCDTTSSLDALMRGLQFYDEQLRVLTFQKEHKPGNFLNAFADQGKGKDGKGKEGKGKDGKGKDGKGKKGDPRVTRAKVLESAKRRLRAKARAKELDVGGPSPETSPRTPATIAIRRGIGLRTARRRRRTNSQGPVLQPMGHLKILSKPLPISH